jgi:hypothetical protein
MRPDSGCVEIPLGNQISMLLDFHKYLYPQASNSTGCECG